MKKRITASLLTIAALCSSLSIMPVHAAYYLETWTDMEYIETYGMLERFATPYAGLDYAVYSSSADGRPDWFVDVFKDRFGFILAENVDADAVKDEVLDIIHTYYPEEEYADELSIVYGFSEAAYGPCFVIDNTPGDDTLQYASAICEELCRRQLIYGFYDCGQIGNYNYMGCDNFIRYDTTAERAEALAAYIAEHYPAYSVVYEAATDYERSCYRVVPDKTLTLEEEIALSAEIHEALSLLPYIYKTEAVFWCYGENMAEAYGHVITPGDIDGNGAVQSTDALIALQEYVQVNVMEEAATLSYTQNLAADIDGDGVISADDALAILSLYVSSMG